MLSDDLMENSLIEKVITMIKVRIITVWVLVSSVVQAQSFTWISSTEGETWESSQVELQNNVEDSSVALEVTGDEDLGTFKAWGATFNELGWDALRLLPEAQQEAILEKLYSPTGDMRFAIGRIPMNANDYARDWYSCDEVDGDFELKYFNIDRDKQTLIPYIQSAQRYNLNLTFWISPWSPPSWMKINHHYACHQGPHNDLTEERSVGRLDYDMFIQAPCYLDAYARTFCKFIDAYQDQDIPITAVMYQNEAYSHWTEYPGCSWSAEGTALFNADYLAPALAQHHPGVELYFGSINSNRLDIIERALSNKKFAQCIKGIGLQWEGGQILSRLKAKYPQYSYVQTESECGSGTFDWAAAEHTFNLINHYVGNGCEKYTFWNSILMDEGSSGWGWKQNALIRVNSQARTATYTPEYYAVKHYCNVIAPGSRLLAFQSKINNKMPTLVFLTPENKYALIMGNMNDTAQTIAVKLGQKYLNATLPAHSFNTFVGNL